MIIYDWNILIIFVLKIVVNDGNDIHDINDPYHSCVVMIIMIPDSARMCRGGSFDKEQCLHYFLRLIGMPVGCRSNERLNLWGASTNEQMVVEILMKWHEINDMKESVHELLNEEWVYERRNNNSWMSRWINQGRKERQEKERTTERLNLVGGLEHFLFSHILGSNHPNWRSYFSEGWLKTTNQ